MSNAERLRGYRANDLIVEEFIPTRLQNGEAYMFCNECGAKLYSFDGSKDSDRKCPYMKHGRCNP